MITSNKALSFSIYLVILLLFNGCEAYTTQPELADNNPQHTGDYTDDNSDNILDTLFSYYKCDQVVEKELNSGYSLQFCYDYSYKSSIFTAYTLDAELVNSVNLPDRPSFTKEEDVPEEYRVSPTDYLGTGYDRGHLAPDASFDYELEDLEQTYSMINIIPQDPTVNRDFWSKAEAYARDMTETLGTLQVVNGVVFDSNPDMLGDSTMSIPIGFWKMLWHDTKDFQRCFYYDNFIIGDSNLDTLDKHEIDCDTLLP